MLPGSFASCTVMSTFHPLPWRSDRVTGTSCVCAPGAKRARAWSAPASAIVDTGHLRALDQIAVIDSDAAIAANRAALGNDDTQPEASIVAWRGVTASPSRATRQSPVRAAEP